MYSYILQLINLPAMLLCDHDTAASVQIFKQSPHVTPACCVLAVENRDKEGVNFYTRHARGNHLIL